MNYPPSSTLGTLCAPPARLSRHALLLVIFALFALVGLVGLGNGRLIARLRINPFVVTLGMQSLLTGLLFVATGVPPVYGVPDSFTVVGLGRLVPVPVAALLYAAVALAVWALLRLTVFGQHVYAVGGNREASRLASIAVARVTTLAYAAGGFPPKESP
ncbi:MAG: hypothetical protein KGL43_13415 [Burkholderiales bacterium]|nr:hypothetical protein [Burkholderiales bacterium]MDE2454585.1 hypothetical protein [Burkholderiales bacterium]